ncbi:MAG: hypothetical protein ABWY33_08225 [Cellulomonas sp.]
MLALSPPYPVVDGYALLPDHADPGLWYVLPSAPQLAVRDGIPALSLTQYLGQGAGAAKVSGGILSLTTQLFVPPDVLEALPARLADVRGVAGSALRVVPAPLDTGTVELVVLGQTSTPPTEGSAAPGGTFEVRFAGGGRPSMGGTQDATFQLVLNEAAAEMIGACLDLPEQPVIVTYAMTFAALRPAFTIDIHADWAKIYSSLKTKLTTNAWYVAADVETAITSAFEESGLRIDTVVEGTGEGARAAAERTRTQLTDWVLDKLFQPMIPPPSTGEQVAAVVDDVVSSLTRAIIPGASFRLKAVDESSVRRMDLRARERVAEVRDLRPQGTLGGLLNALRVDEKGEVRPTWPAVRQHLVQQVELSGFPRLEVGVEVVDRFASDRLRSVQVEVARAPLDPAAEPAVDAELTFTAPGQHKDWVVNLLEEAQRETVWDRPYVYRVSADFDPSSPVRPPGQAVSAWRTRQSTDLVVDPREAYAVTDVTVTVAPLFSFALFPAVTVELRPGSAAAAPATARVQLDADHPLQHWSFASLPDDVSYSSRATYHRPPEAGGDVVSPWSSAVEPFCSLPDPMPEKLTVTFFVDLPWAELAAALLQVRYQDEAAGVRYPEETVRLGADTPNVSRTYSIAAGGSRSVAYRLTLQPLVGALVDGSWRAATDDRVIVDRRLVEERQVQVKVLGSLAEQKLLRATLRLEVRDPADQHVRASADLALVPGAEQAAATPFAYRLGDPPVRQVWWQLTTVDVNGFVAAQPWGSGTSDLLVVDVRSRTVSG